jgi:hypothetical protein
MCSSAVRPPTRFRALSLASFLLLVGACGSHFVARGSALYDDGHYVEAADVFEQTEARLASCSSEERARFGLYRGATFLKLGDVEHAARWLGYARAIERSQPGALDGNDSALLDSSLQALGNKGGTPPAHSESSEVATAPAP